MDVAVFRFVLLSFLVNCIVQTGSTATVCNKGPIHCDFDTDLCGFKLEGHWTNTTSYRTYIGQHIPSSQGGSSFIVNDWSTQSAGPNIVTSPCLDPGTYNMTIWYFMTGPSVSLIVNTSTGNVLVNKTDPDRTWKPLTLTVAERQSFQILVSVGAATSGGIFAKFQTIGIDSISIEPSKGPTADNKSQGSCAFSSQKVTDNCGYTFGPRWTIHNGDYQLGPQTIISQDKGHESYALFDGRSPITVFNKTGTEEHHNTSYDLVSPEIPAGQYNVTFSYIAPAGADKLDVLIDTRLVGSFTVARFWNQISMNVTEFKPFRIVFRGYLEYTGGYRPLTTLMALDNVIISSIRVSTSEWQTTSQTTLQTTMLNTTVTTPLATKPLTSISEYSKTTITDLINATALTIDPTKSASSEYSTPEVYRKTLSTSEWQTTSQTTLQTTMLKTTLTTPLATKPLTSISEYSKTTITDLINATALTIDPTKSASSEYSTPEVYEKTLSTPEWQTTSQTIFHTTMLNTMVNTLFATKPLTSTSEKTKTTITDLINATALTIDPTKSASSEYSTPEVYRKTLSTSEWQTASQTTLQTTMLNTTLTTPLATKPLTSTSEYTKTTITDLINATALTIDPTKSASSEYSTPEVYKKTLSQSEWQTTAQTTLQTTMLNTTLTTPLATKPLTSTSEYTKTTITDLINATALTIDPTKSASSEYSTPEVYKKTYLERALTASCTSTKWNISIDMEQLRHDYTNANQHNIFLGESSCVGDIIGHYLVFTKGLHECSSIHRISGDNIVYENKVYYEMTDPDQPFIVRQPGWTYTVECDVTRNVANSSHLHHDIESHHVSVNAKFDINMAFYQDPNFMEKMTGNPLHVAVGDTVYVKVYTTTADWTVKMRLHTCYTKPNDKADDKLIYYIIKNGCEVDRNTHLMSQSTHETRFMFQDFEYTTYREGLDIHCNATFCDADDFSHECTQMCQSP